MAKGCELCATSLDVVGVIVGVWMGRRARPLLGWRSGPKRGQGWRCAWAALCGGAWDHGPRAVATARERRSGAAAARPIATSGDPCRGHRPGAAVHVGAGHGSLGCWRDGTGLATAGAGGAPERHRPSLGGGQSESIAGNGKSLRRSPVRSLAGRGPKRPRGAFADVAKVLAAAIRQVHPANGDAAWRTRRRGDGAVPRSYEARLARPTKFPRHVRRPLHRTRRRSRRWLRRCCRRSSRGGRP